MKPAEAYYVLAVALFFLVVGWCIVVVVWWSVGVVVVGADWGFTGKREYESSASTAEQVRLWFGWFVVVEC